MITEELKSQLEQSKLDMKTEEQESRLEVKTEEQVNRTIKSSFDSVNLINNIVAKKFDLTKVSIIKNNVEHLKLMLSKDWFSEALTQQQKTDIDSCIAAGNNYNDQ